MPKPSDDASPDMQKSDTGRGKSTTKRAAKAAERVASPNSRKTIGRPRKTPTPAQVRQVEQMAMRGLGKADMAAVLDMDRGTFARYEEEYFRTAIEKGVASLRNTTGRVLIREANKGNMTAIIWLEKTRLGITEKVHTIVPLPGGGSGEAAAALGGPVNVIAIGLYLPQNGRDVPAAGQTLPKELQVAEVPPPAPSVGIVLPSNGRDPPSAP